ncbi:hypothetical protein RJ639_006402 [Escallonia herrerae]|uniref:Uncharacterized protein n=1 Tax=Escallonia herrerae TaxID=1293975 RepID=A0AA88W085_9ASTE|nr:hypothetical protein RJ639_006402 [Escallonia herrerae]
MSKTDQFPGFILSDFVGFCSCVLSQPLYFSYFIFFSPYLLRLLSFLSPLVITTSLLLLTLLTVSPTLGFSRTGVMDDENDEEFYDFEAFEAYKIVFDDASAFDVRESPVVEVPAVKAEESCLEVVEVSQMETAALAMEEKSMECFLKELDSFENMAFTLEEEKKVEPPVASSNKETLGKSGSEAICIKVKDSKTKFSNGGESFSEVTTTQTQTASTKVKGQTDNGEEDTSEVVARTRRTSANVNGTTDIGGEYTLKVESSGALESNLGSYGSMRKEKEWKRTLACKLFEERHNVDGVEGMDSLWEAYEMDSSKAKPKGNNVKKKGMKKGGVKCYEDSEDDYEEEMGANGQLCCLQALKFSAGKMNMGMGRPSLVKLSKALKGFGWLHQVSKHGKKGHQGERF